MDDMTMATTLNKKRKAARKGWQTRRANTRKRSAAAKKGWQTRRANARRRQQRKQKRQEAEILKGAYQGETYEIKQINGKTIEVILGSGSKARTYTKQMDLRQFETFIQHVRRSEQ